MFKKYDIVKLPDGRAGIVESMPSPFSVTVKLGADGPFVTTSVIGLSFTASIELENAGGNNFFKN